MRCPDEDVAERGADVAAARRPRRGARAAAVRGRAAGPRTCGQGGRRRGRARQSLGEGRELDIGGGL